MIAVWKIRRELQRVGQQVSALPEAVWEPWVQRRHDKAFAKGFPVFDGNGTLNQKIAIFLIYQQGTLPQSIVETCNHLTKHDYCVLIVANGGLPTDSRARLLPHVWKILDRPNVGYDFGGYRDGILQLQTWQIEPEKLLILNDSIWFPIFPQDNLLARMEIADTEVAGTILRHKNGQVFLESYLYLIKGSVLKNPAVQHYWKSYRLTANKYKVIRRGERGHSKALIDAGYKLFSMYLNSDFMARLARADDAFLANTLRFGVAETAGLSGERDALLGVQRTKDWRNAVLSHVERVLKTAQFYSAFPYASVKLMNYPVLKKSGDMVSVLWRKAYLRAIDAKLVDSPSDEFLSEVNACFNKDQPQ